MPGLDFPGAKETADGTGPQWWLGRCTQDEPVKTTALAVKPETAPGK